MGIVNLAKLLKEGAQPGGLDLLKSFSVVVVDESVLGVAARHRAQKAGDSTLAEVAAFVDDIPGADDHAGGVILVSME